MKSTCWKLKSHASLEDFASISLVRSSHEIPTKLSTWRIFKCDFLTLHPYYIYPHYPQKYERLFREKNPRQVFYHTHTHLSKRESYSSLVRNHFSLFFFPLSLSYLKRRFVPKHNPHLFRVQRVFQSLKSFGDLPKESGEAWWMQQGVLRNPESQRRHDFEKSIGSRSLKGSSTLGKLGLEGLLLFVYLNLLSSGSIYRLKGGKEVFRRVLRFPLR